MAGRKLSVVISQAPGKNPQKRQLEEDLATKLMLSGIAEVSLIPHLYDLPSDHHSLLFLRNLRSDMVVLGWLFPRALRWTLDRNGITGHEGVSLLDPPNNDDDEDAEEAGAQEATGPTGIGSVNVLNREIFVIDLRDQKPVDVYYQEIERIARDIAAPVVTLSSLFDRPASSPSRTPGAPAGSNGATTNGHGPSPTAPTATPLPAAEPLQSPFVFSAPIAPSAEGAAPLTFAAGGDGAEIRRRWYPVIDYSRCTNCMECLDFCLFGVYGVDAINRILVEEQDNCKRGCPACSRVCPANAIIFPEHKTAAIAGAPVSGAGDFKIDLSKLFGAPNALEMAAMERDTELVRDGREAVGLTVGIPKRQAGKTAAAPDELDALMDQLDALD